MEAHQEVLSLAERLATAAVPASQDEFTAPINKIKSAAEAVGRSASGSWLGYHANVYYAGLSVPPPGAHFSSEWGMKELFGSLGSRGDWREYNPDDIRATIRDRAGNPSLEFARSADANANRVFQAAKSDALSILEQELARSPDKFLENLKSELEKLDTVTPTEVVDHIQPKGQVMTRDMVAMGQGFRAPPHVLEVSEALALSHNVELCSIAADVLRKVGSHLERKARRSTRAGRVGTNVFIGHGRSHAWRELKDFVQDRVGLPWDEFNRVPVAGITNIARLSEMLDAAAIAFLVMTAEDERADGTVQARMNVIHEAGLFQGRLGFTKAIVVLEEGCAEFSNIQGLGQIRFPAGRISAAFEDIRQVLEREGLTGPS